MDKKILLAAAAVITTCALTVPAEAARAYDGVSDSNFYLGGYGGYGWTDSGISPGPGADPKGVDYGVIAGWEITSFMKNAMGVRGAIEAFYGWSNQRESSSGTSAEKNHEWGVNVRPGLDFLDRAMPFDLKPYAILGYRRTQFESTVTGAANRDDFNGFELGAGTEFASVNDIGTRFDYSHVFYGSEGRMDPDEDDVRISLVKHF